jgi:cytoskeletal protein CcmA (bactofilin family)
VKGEISGNADLLIDGSVEGLIQLSDRNLTVGTTAKVVADIIAWGVVIYGKVKGNVRARGKIEIKKGGSVTGDLTTPQILIEDEAYFDGSIEISRRARKRMLTRTPCRQRPSVPTENSIQRFSTQCNSVTF